MKKISIILVSLCLAFSSLSFAKGDKKAGKILAKTCTGCHGENGISVNPDWPNLAGQQYGYLVKQIKAFRDVKKPGARKNPLMNSVVSQLSDLEVNNLAAYFNSLK